MNTDTGASVSTHVLDTGLGRPATGVAVSLEARGGPASDWAESGRSRTGQDGRCADLPALPAGTTQVRLTFGTEAYFDRVGRAEALPRSGTPFFPEVTVTFTAAPGEHYHVPLLLSPFGYSVYRGS